MKAKTIICENHSCQNLVLLSPRLFSFTDQMHSVVC